MPSTLFGYANVSIKRRDGFVGWEHFQCVINAIRHSAFSAYIVHIGVDFPKSTPISMKIAITSYHGSSLKDGTEKLIRFLADELGDLSPSLSIEEQINL